MTSAPEAGMPDSSTKEASGAEMGEGPGPDTSGAPGIDVEVPGARSPKASPGRPTVLAPDRGLSRSMLALFTVAAGAAVANIYYAQPLLPGIASAFRVGSGTAALLATLSSIGYAAGLALLVPLGDVVRRRLLVTLLLLITAAALVACAVAPTFAALAIATAVLAVAAVVGPILVPFAATLATPEQRGAVTGTVLSGVLVGVLVSRAGGGLVAGLGGGWRVVYAAAAVLTALLAVVLGRLLPDLPPAQRLGYGELLRSVLAVVRAEPVLRLRSGYGFFGFGSFSVFWTSAAFLLARWPYHYSQTEIGVFALVGVAGATSAKVVGRFTDTGRDRSATGLLLAAILLGWGLMAVRGGGTLVTLVLGVVVLDFGVQGAHVANLAAIYRLAPQIRSRVTTVYLTSNFLGGVAGTAASGAAYATRGWGGVCGVGAAFTVAALALWGVDAFRTRSC